jgi:hypothetical protein
VNKFAVNLSSDFVHNQYFKVLIVPQAVIAEVLRHFFTVLDCLRICLELNADAIPIRDAVFHIEKEPLHWWSSIAGLIGLSAAMLLRGHRRVLRISACNTRDLFFLFASGKNRER